jgi:hypothetical protein
MSEPDRPPLHPITCEQIDVLLHKVDQRHWSVIRAMRIPIFVSPSDPVPPKLPRQLVNNLIWYASELFKTEADNYGEFRRDGRYAAWIERLADRIVKRVLAAVERIERGNFIATLKYHGVSETEMEKSLRDALRDIGNSYAWKDSNSQIKIEAAQPAAQASVQPTAPVPYPEPLAQQLRDLRDECDITAETMAEALGVDPRSIYKHLAAQTVPRRNHIDAYEKLFSERLNRSVILKRSVKGQRIKSKRSVKSQ